MEKTYRAAVIGCGAMGVTNIDDPSIPFTYSFAGAILKTPQTKLVALVDTDLDKVQALARRFDVAAYTDITHMLDQQKPDIVCCAAGPDANSTVICEASQLGIKGVYCEKPLCLSLDQADALAEIEKNSTTKMQVNYLRNYDTFHRSTLDYIRKGGIGNLQAVRTTYNGGVLSVFPHTTALLSKLFDGAKSVSGVLSPIANISTRDDPNIDGVIRYHFAPQNRDVSVQLLATGRGKEENNTYIYELEFTGSKARITIHELGWSVRYEEMRQSRIFKDFETQPFQTDIVPPELCADRPREFILDGLARLTSAIENNTSTDCPLSAARDAEEIAHALGISAARNGQSITLPLQERVHAFKDARAGVTLLKQQAGLPNKK